MSSFVSTSEGERHKCSFTVDPTSTIKGDPKLQILSHPKLLQMANTQDNWEEGANWRTLWAPGRCAGPCKQHDRALYKTPVLELMGHTFFGSVGRI